MMLADSPAARLQEGLAKSVKEKKK